MKKEGVLFSHRKILLTSNLFTDASLRLLTKIISQQVQDDKVYFTLLAF